MILKKVLEKILLYFFAGKEIEHILQNILQVSCLRLLLQKERVFLVWRCCVTKKTPGILKDYFRLLVDCYNFDFYVHLLYRGEHIKTGNKFLDSKFDKIYKKLYKSKNKSEQFIYNFCLEASEKINNPDIEMQDLYDFMLNVVPQDFSDYSEYLRSNIIVAGQTCGWNCLFLNEKRKEFQFLKSFYNYNDFKIYLSYS